MDVSSLFDPEDIRENAKPKNEGIPLMYTSYFGAMSKFPDTVEPIAICGGIPDWYKGKWMRKLAPSWSIWKEWHDSTAPDKNEHYIKRFIPERLGRLDVKQIVSEILELADGKIPCLLCYEKPGDFCHRHLVADWLNKSGLSKIIEFDP